MQAAVGLSAVLPVVVRARPAARRSINPMAVAARRMPACRVRATAQMDDDDTNISVFPVEACEVVGGEACEAHMYPEAKLGEAARGRRVAAPEEVEREYLAYDEPKTVFVSEACDDLGGEFCEPPYQTHVDST